MGRHRSPGRDYEAQTRRAAGWNTHGVAVVHDQRPAVPANALGTGVAVWLLSETMFFAGLFAAYFTLRSANPTWPPADVTLDTARAGVFTVLLVASSYTMRRAERDVHAGTGSPVAWLAATVVLGAVFLVNQALEYASLGFTMASHAYGTIYFVLTGFHGLHVLGGLLAIAALTAAVQRDSATLPAARTTRAVAVYWHFVDVIWIVVFLTIFVIR